VPNSASDVICVIFDHEAARLALERSIREAETRSGRVCVIVCYQPSWSWDNPLAAMAGAPVHDQTVLAKAEMEAIVGDSSRLDTVRFSNHDQFPSTVETTLSEGSYCLVLVAASGKGFFTSTAACGLVRRTSRLCRVETIEDAA
jgi:hypothetical protein